MTVKKKGDDSGGGGNAWAGTGHDEQTEGHRREVPGCERVQIFVLPFLREQLFPLESRED